MTTQAPTEPIEILLVEDNPGDVRLTQEAFKAASFETVFHIATDGDEAFEFLSECREIEDGPCPDFVLLDLNLPRMDGFAVLEALRNHPEFSPIPVLVLTSSDAKEDVVKSYERSANAYLTKPDRPDEFVSLVRAVEDFWVETATLPPLPS